MKPIDEKLAKLANKAEIKVNDRSKEEKQAYDKGFVTGVLSIALEFELDKEEVASFLEERRVLTKAIELLESKRPHGKWIFDGVYCDENNPIDSDMYHCNLCKRSIMTTSTRPTDLFPFCHCGADMREADNEDNSH